MVSNQHFYLFTAKMNTLHEDLDFPIGPHFVLWDQQPLLEWAKSGFQQPRALKTMVFSKALNYKQPAIIKRKIHYATKDANLLWL